jgi:hypothetical protein
MDNNEIQAKTFEIALKSLDSIEKNNQRLFIGLIVCVCAMALTIFGIAYCYFFSNYQYPTITQNQATNGSTANQNTGTEGVIKNATK